MLDRQTAQSLIDGFAAAALAAAVVGVARPWSASPMRPRLAFAFGGICLFFGARAASIAMDSQGLSLASQGVGCLLPLAALVLAEGLLRRHAPIALKALICAGGAVAILGVLITGGEPPASNWGLGVYVVLSLAAVTGLLLARDRASLSRQENASVETLMVAGGLLTLLSITDFLDQAPVGLSGLGAAMVAYALNASPTSRGEARLVLGNLTSILALAAIGASVLAAALGIVGIVEQVRFGVVLVAGLLAAGAVLDARRRAASPARGFALALAEADTSTLDAFLADLAGQPLLAGLRLAEGRALADYDPAGLSAEMSRRAVWTREALAETARPNAPRAVEELSDLMERMEATHALLVSTTPVRIALLTLPGAGPAYDAAADLAVFRKLALLVAGGRS